MMIGRFLCGLRKAAESIAVMLLIAMFSVFLLQIFSRYILVQPFGWTLELCLTLWVWLVFWSNAFVVKHREHVAFDMLYTAVPSHVRRVFAAITALVIAVVLALSFLPSWDFIDFLKIKKSPTLRIPMRTVYSIYAVFLIGATVAYAYRFWFILRRGIPEERPEEQ